jgi:fibronectin-binding autotransporter adhesin
VPVKEPTRNRWPLSLLLIVLFASHGYAQNIINVGTTLQITNDLTGVLDGFLDLGGVTLNGGTVLTNNLLDLPGGIPFSTVRTISINTTGGILEAATGTVATYDGSIINGNGGTGVLTIGGTGHSGTVAFAAANSYTGETLLNGATLQLSGAGTLGASTASLTVNDGATLDLNGTHQTVGAVILNGATIATSTGAATLAAASVTVEGSANVINHAVTVTGNIAQNVNSILTVNGAAGADSLGALATLKGTGTVGVVTLSSNDTVTTTGTLGTAGITVNGSGNLISGVETATGGLSVSALGAVTQTGTLTGALTDNGIATIDGTLTGSASVGSGGTLTGTGVVTGLTNVTGGTLNGVGIILDGLTTFNGTGNILSGTETGNVVLDAGAAVTQTGTLMGNVNLTAGTGTSLAGVGTVGNVTLNGSGDALLSSGVLTTASVAVNGVNNTIGSGTIGGNVTLASGAALTDNGTLSGAVTMSNGTLSGTGAVTGAVNVSGGTINGTGLDLNGSAIFSGAGNVLSGTETGRITLAANANLNQSGTLTGNVALTAGATALAGTGTVGTVTLNGGGDTVSSGSIFTTSGITVNGTGNTLASGTIAGDVTLGNGASLAENTNLNGSVAIGSGTLTGTGSVSGTITIGSGGALDLENGAIGTLTTGGLVTGSVSTASSLSFDIGSGLGVNDKIQDSGALTLNGTGGTDIVIGNASGTTSLANGTYTLVVSAGVTGSLANTTLLTTTLDGSVLNLDVTATGIDLVVSTATTTVGTNYSLVTTAGANRIMSGQSTSLLTTITNTGSGLADTLDYSGLGAGGTGVSGSTTNGGPLPDDDASGSNSGQTFTSTTTGAHTISAVVGDATNGVLGTQAVGTTAGTVIDVLANRTETATSVDFGRLLVGETSAAATTIRSVTGDDDSLTRVTLDGTSQAATGVTDGTITLDTGTAYQFGGANDQTNTTTRNLTGSFTTAGVQTGTAVITPTGESLVGEVVNTIGVGYTADAVAQRIISNGTTTDLGSLHNGSVIHVVSNAFTSTGLNATTTSVKVAAGSGVADANGITLNGSATTFDGSSLNSSGSLTFGGTITGSGAVSGDFDLAVTTLENGGLGLTGETAYAPVDVGYTADVYSGQGVYVGTTGGTYGTISTHPGFSTSGGAPGLDPNFTTTDTATFENSIGDTAATVTLDGDVPSLNTITFENTDGGSFTLAQGTGGNYDLDASTGTAEIDNESGDDTISAPIVLESNTDINVASGSRLTLSGPISESGGVLSLTIDGPGTTILSGDNTYSGGTTLVSGVLDITGSGTLGATTGPLTVESGLLDLGGTTQTVGAVDITGASTIQDGTLNGTSFTDSANSGIVALTANLAGPGALDVTGAGTLELYGDNSYTGGTVISNSTVIIGNLNAFGDGNVSLTGGTLETGNGVHVINVDGNYTQSGGTLVLNVTGTAQGGNPGYDYLHVTGTASLGGTLMVNVSSPYVPVTGDRFSFVQAGTIVGGFSTVETNLYSLSITQQGQGVIVSQLPFATLPGVPYTSNESSIAQSIDTGIRSNDTNAHFVTLVEALNGLSGMGMSPNSLANAMDELSPEKFSSFATGTGFNESIFDTEMINQYLASRRDRQGNIASDGSDFDTSGLTVIDPTMDPSLAEMHSHLLAWNPAPSSEQIVSDSGDPALGGVATQDPNTLVPSGNPANKPHFFAEGNVVLAQGAAQGDVPYFNSTTGSIRIGGDYQFSPVFLVGAIFDYSHTEANLDDQGSKARVDSYSPGIYASYASKGWYANALATYSHNDYSENREIGFLGTDAQSSPTGSQFSGSLTGGYDFHAQNWTFGPTLGAQYTYMEINGYSETGSAGDLTVDRQDNSSLRSLLGGRVSYETTAHGVVFHPYVDLSWQHEFMDQSRGINSSLNAVGGGSFLVLTNQPSRDSGLVDFGLSVDLNRTATIFADYMAQFGQQDYFAQFLQAGVRIGF